jgi:hypothetical protein
MTNFKAKVSFIVGLSLPYMAFNSNLLLAQSGGHVPGYARPTTSSGNKTTDSRGGVKTEARRDLKSAAGRSKMADRLFEIKKQEERIHGKKPLELRTGY